MKQCTKCRDVKEAKDFPKDLRLLSGLSSQCRGCHGIRVAKHYKANREHRIAQSRAWQLANPERCAELQQKARAKIPRISADEWEIRKVAARKRAVEKRLEYARRYQEKHADRMGEDAGYREAYYARRRAIAAKARLPQKKLTAERKRREELKSLRNDIASFRVGRIKRKRSHHIICPLLRFYPDLHAAAQQERQWLRDARQDPERKRAQVRRWKNANPAKVSIQRYRRRVNLQNCVADLTEDQWAQIKVVYKNRCGYCHERKPLTQDHIIPVSKGGDHTASNIVPACRSCNSRKNARLPIVSYQPHLIA